MIQTRRSLRILIYGEKIELTPESVKQHIYRNCERRGKDLLNKKRRRFGDVSLDAALDEESQQSLHDSLGEDDRLHELWVRLDDEASMSDEIQSVSDALVELGGIKREKMEIFSALLKGGKPDEVAKEFGASRGKVDNIKYEMKRHLSRILDAKNKGLPLHEAIKMTRVKPSASEQAGKLES